jgi:hypothetical protein
MMPPIEPTATPLYYSASCGFCGLAEYKYQDDNARGGPGARGVALHLDPALNHVEVARLLLNNGHGLAT